MKKLLIANRGEIAIRIAHAASAYGLESVAIYSSDDELSLHTRKADSSACIPGTGVAAYLDIQQIIQAALDSGADAIHPGYGFLSENAEFAQACSDAKLVFVGPSVKVLNAFGDKLQARNLAKQTGLPVAAGSFEATNFAEAEKLFAEIEGGVMLKAVAGGGGRGMRPVTKAAELADAWERCSSEARGAFGNGDLYVEQLLPAARHIEVQIIGDGNHVIALGERECSLQRRHQKLLEIAPAPGIPEACRQRLYQQACQLASAVNYKGLGTVEFMVWDNWQQQAFIEVNPRLQVEHTVTEETTGLDLVSLQLAIAEGKTLADLRLVKTPPASGFAVQARINMETMRADGSALPAGGVLETFEMPNGPNVRVDHFAYRGYRSSPNYDSLLAKVISKSTGDDFGQALNACYRALCECRIEGIDTNIEFLKSLLRNPTVIANGFDAEFIDKQATSLLASATISHPQRFVSSETKTSATHTADTLASTGPDGSLPVPAPMQGTVIAVSVSQGETIYPGQELLIMEAMKLEHVITAPAGGQLARLDVAVGDTVFAEHPLLHIFEAEVGDNMQAATEQVDLEYVRPDLQNVADLHALTADAARPDKVAKMHARGKQTARENIAQLTEGGDFLEYGALAVAAQRTRRGIDDLRKNTPADGIVTGVGEINRELFGKDASRSAIMAYDYSVLAGTQGYFSHRKTDRMIEVIEKDPMPLVFFCEGGGGRPGDLDAQHLGGFNLDCTSFGNLAALNGKAPMVGINAGYAFAGNAAFLAMNDIIISTKNSWIGMGGPAMIEGGGLGAVDKNEIGPADVQVANGTIDVLVDNEFEAVQAAQKYLSYFQGNLAEWKADDQRRLRHLVPENRNRGYDMRAIINSLADHGSVLELRPNYASGYITSFARIEGKPIAILANNNQVLSGAIDAECARKADRFLKLCQQFGMRVLFLVDCPGLMVGPEYDKQGTARAAGDMYVSASRLTVPMGSIVIRKAYGLGAMAAMAGSSKIPSFCVAWPTGESAPMGIEGAVHLGYKKELAAIKDPAAREAQFKAIVEQAYQRANVVNSASAIEIDAVIDPAESRRWINGVL